MKVKTIKGIHNPDFTPIMIQFKDHIEKDQFALQIIRMTGLKYCIFPSSMTKKEVEEFMEVKIITKEDNHGKSS